MERMEALTNYYTTHNEDAQLTSKHGMVEFLTTIHYVEKYLKRTICRQENYRIYVAL